MNIPQDLKYTKEHEWIRVEGNRVTVGITDYAQDQLGDIVFVELPAVGDEVESGDGFAVLESVKAAADVYAPVSGTVVEVNEDLEDDPALVNTDPYGQGWLAVFELAEGEDLSELMTAEEYQQFLAEQE
ncbi:MAG: glycine cleavage system protein GcvH [Firmicutes bacterium]|nr:glycine cleavage system protein GcvH [Bacillota bacterium]HOB35203.1 glycine cleavage system protein GcvH [Bacillota bacterium]HPZ90297.1 glycine cleavage system protein GcvH [Bacillota bacterium]HQE01802.1 glycine cleavage system protein GcvH [Bacillota bacterium]